MSLKHEQYRSLHLTRALLSDLLNPRKRPKTVAQMRERVGRCLRHFPPLDDTGAPMFSRDAFDCPPLRDEQTDCD
jgi:hypothetical protein